MKKTESSTQTGYDVFRIGPRWRNEIVGFQIDDPDRTILTAAIVATFFVPRVVHAISDASSVSGNLSLVSARQGHRFFDAAFSRHGPETRRAARRPRRAVGGKENRLAVGCPTFDEIGARMPRQTLRLAAFGRHDVNVEVACILAAERDPSSVGRKMWIRSLSLKTRQSFCAATGARHDPDIVCISETDLSCANGRRAQQTSLSWRAVSVLRAGFCRKNQKTECEERGSGRNG